MTNLFFTNNFTERAKFMIANPNTWQQAMEDAGLTYANQRHPGQPAISSWTIDPAHRAAATAVKFAKDAITGGWSWIPIDLPKDAHVQRFPIKDDRKVCDCKLKSGHEQWCPKWEAYKADE
jgi:hypothetical protein